MTAEFCSSENADNGFESFKKLNYELAALISRELKILEECGCGAVQEGVIAKLETEKSKLLDSTFIVLVMGMFSSGKSAFLNGLLGDRILPMKAVPTTAIIGEISYSDNEQITLLPKKGCWPKTGDKPFDISREELSDYITIDNDAKERKESPFDKVFIKTPLGICRNGVVLVDSPGLNDSTDHEKETDNYQSNADTIIYCIDAQTPVTNLDKLKIEELSGLGYKSIIFVFTKVDLIEENDQNNGTHDAEDVRRSMLKNMSKYTELGQYGVFFVNSMGAIKGKRKNNKEILEKSGFTVLESKLKDFLVKQKGRLKQARSLHALRRANIDARRYLSDRIDILSQEKGDLECGLQKAQYRLDRARAEIVFINKQLENEVRHVVDSMEVQAHIFADKLIELIPNWVTEYEPDAAISFNPMTVNASIQKMGDEMQENVKSKMRLEINAWLLGRSDDMVNGLKRTLKSYDVNIQNCSNELAELRRCLKLVDIDSCESVPNKIDRIIGAAVGLLMGNVNCCIQGGLFGWKAALGNVGVNGAVCILLFAILGLNPMCWPVLLTTAFINTILGGFVSVITFKSILKAKVIEENIRVMKKNRCAFINDVKTASEEIVRNLIKNIRFELEAPIREAKAQVEAADAVLHGNGADIEDKLRTCREALKENDAIDRELSDDKFVFQ